MKTLKAMSDRLLKLFLSDVSAGACVAENGKCCGVRHKRYNCYGSCITTTAC